MRCYRAPNLLILSRAIRPPIPVLDDDAAGDKEQLAVEGPATEGTKEILRGKSRKSSLNLARVLSSLDWKKHGRCLHVTLGYWKRWPSTKEDLADTKASLVAILGRKVRCGIWSLEYQVERFAKFGDWVPHFHCLLWIGRGDAEVFEVWVRRWWARFAENASEHGVHVTSGDQARGTWYLAMHAAKAAQAPPFAVGRWWGYIKRGVLLEAQDLHDVGEVNSRELVWWSRMFRRQNHLRVRQHGQHGQGLSWFLPRGAQCVLSAWIRDHVAGERRQRLRGKDPF